jgi:hypothetical protein
MTGVRVLLQGRAIVLPADACVSLPCSHAEPIESRKA